MWTRGFNLTGRERFGADRFLVRVDANRTLAPGTLESGSRPEQVWTRPYSLNIALKPCTSHKTSTGCCLPAHQYTSSQILNIYGVSVVICGGLLTRLAAANHHKPPPKRRKYAGFGTMGIPAIRESIVLHRQGLATLKEPNCLRLSLNLAVVCSGLRWFACIEITAYSSSIKLYLALSLAPVRLRLEPTT